MWATIRAATWTPIRTAEGLVRVRWCSRADGVRIRVDVGDGPCTDPPAADGLRVATELTEVTVLHSSRGTTVRLAFPLPVDDQGGGAA
ncbi:hypothetical protein [Pseudonocardia sp. NPDC049154]|uniref:hypothetical protein n=1 Tax=Pseudonocardia sp. NPDC049154 TaxID=3155501 RepID=UPI0033FE3718